MVPKVKFTSSVLSCFENEHLPQANHPCFLSKGGREKAPLKDNLLLSKIFSMNQLSEDPIETPKQLFPTVQLTSTQPALRQVPYPTSTTATSGSDIPSTELATARAAISYNLPITVQC